VSTLSKTIVNPIEVSRVDNGQTHQEIAGVIEMFQRFTLSGTVLTLNSYSLVSLATGGHLCNKELSLNYLNIIVVFMTLFLTIIFLVTLKTQKEQR